MNKFATYRICDPRPRNADKWCCSYFLAASFNIYIRKAVGVLAALFALSSCTQQVESPDADISKDAFTIYGKALGMLDNAAIKPYAGSGRAKTYQEIQDSIQVLKLRAIVSTNPHDNAVLAQADLLSDAFAHMQHQDETGWGTDKKGVEDAIQNNRNKITTIIYAILKKQAIIKGLSSSSGTSSPAPP
jgi:hypothetical protein